MSVYHPTIISRPTLNKPLYHNAFYPPEGCRARSDCQACRSAGMLFLCRGCLRLLPWCVGAADCLPGHCDDCWARLHGATPGAQFRAKEE